MRQLLILLILGILSSITPIYVNGKTHEHIDKFDKAATQFMCQCGCGQSVSACSMESCGVNDAFKKDLMEKINQNMTINDIKKYYVDMYGEIILMSPLKKGFSLAAWLVPILIIFSGSVGYIYFIRRRQNTGLPIPIVEEGNSIDSSIQMIIDEERKKYL